MYLGLRLHSPMFAQALQFLLLQSPNPLYRLTVLPKSIATPPITNDTIKRHDKEKKGTQKKDKIEKLYARSDGARSACKLDFMKKDMVNHMVIFSDSSLPAIFCRNSIVFLLLLMVSALIQKAMKRSFSKNILKYLLVFLL